MEKFDYLIVSDIHLGDKDCKSELLLKVLKKQKGFVYRAFQIGTHAFKIGV